MPARHIEAMLDKLRTLLDVEGNAWLDKAIEKLGATDDVENTLAMQCAMAGRRLGAEPAGAGAGVPDSGYGPVKIAAWPLADIARVGLIGLAAARAADPAAVVRQAYRNGDETERAAILRGLVLFTAPDRLLPVAAEATRVNSLKLYVALALDNPYPAAFFADPQFNQLVLKCLFNGLPIAHILRLQDRANADLARMCEDYVHERMDAGRSVPADIWLAIGPHASADGDALLTRALASEFSEHRYFAARAAAPRAADHPALRSALLARIEDETESRISEVLHKAVAK